MKLSKLILSLWGWKVTGNLPSEKKFIAVEAPHTSMWDFIIGRTFFYSIGYKPRFLMKKELFFFPVGWLLRRMGGIPVDRYKKGDMVEKMTDKFKKESQLALIITPEGTRQKVNDWKLGFYYIARSANVPIVPAFLDYRKKVIGIGDSFYATENVDNDILRIKSFVSQATPKHPERYN
jgi:1-acyl-sn-glycerol-3-phosphate acyltransferase